MAPLASSDTLRSAPPAPLEQASTPTTTARVAAQPTTVAARNAELMAQALRAAQVRAGPETVGFPTRVVEQEDRPGVFGAPAARIDFSHRSGTSRVCPISRIEHESNHFFVTLGVETERTGLPAFFLYCHSHKDCNVDKRCEMLAFVDPASYETLGIDCSSAPTALSMGQTIVVLGKMQEQVDRLIENPGGAWKEAKHMEVIACALCTAASGHALPIALAKSMLDKLLEVSELTEGEKQLASFAFNRAREPMDPLGVVRGYAEGLNGKRDQELMMVREAIVACTDPALEADVRNAAENLMKALDTLVYVKSDGKLGGYCDVEFGGLFVFYVWHRVARLSFDKWQTATDKKHEFYLFNGATYKSGQKDAFVQLVFTHLKRTAESLREVAPLRVRAERLVERIANAGDYFTKLTHHALAIMQNPTVLERCGQISPEEFHDKLDTGPYIGFTNGVYDTVRDVFMPMGQVGHNVLVSMSTKLAYVYPDDPRVPRMRAEIDGYYATLFAEDASDAGDALLRQARVMVGSYLYPCNVAKKMHVFLGHEGNNGKSAFAEFLRLTLGDYYATGNIGALTPGPRETLDVEIIRNYKALVCSFPEAQSSTKDGHSMSLRLDSGKLKVMTGNDNVCARGLYQMPRNIGIKNKPLIMSNSMPELDHGDEAACGRVRVTRFGSRFSTCVPASGGSGRVYRCIPDLNAKLAEWAPFHMLMMLEWLRAFKESGCRLEAGDEHTEGSYANRAVASQTPEGKLRAWVDENYTQVPLKEKDTGTKLEVLYAAYVAAAPPVHVKALGRNTFAKLLGSIYPNVGPHKNSNHTVSGLFLLR